MSKKVVHFDRIGIVTFSKNKRSKNIKISVKPNKNVLVSFPFYVSAKEVSAFVLKNENWIKQQQEKFDSKKNRFDENSVIETRQHKIVFARGVVTKAELKANIVEITVKHFEDEQAQLLIENVLTEIYRLEAKNILPDRLKEIAVKNGFSYNKVTIRNNKRNWGSCSFKNNISLNLQMMKLPDILIDYILLHELVHTEIKNHGEKFWNRMNQLTNNEARQLARQVKQHSTYT
jgi:hypothetical protein